MNEDDRRKRVMISRTKNVESEKKEKEIKMKYFEYDSHLHEKKAN